MRRPLHRANYLLINQLSLVGTGGFEPPKLKTTDLQSVPFGHSGISPTQKRAEEGTRTPDQLITNQLLYQLSYSGFFVLKQRTTPKKGIAKVIILLERAKVYSKLSDFFWQKP
jgi:hypothetical protein